MNASLEFRKSSYSAQNQNCVEVATLPVDFYKSSHSGAGQDCVEVATIPTGYRKSSYSSGNSQNCVEVAGLPRAAAIRDSKYIDAGHLVFPAAEWDAFLGAARAGRL